MGLTNCKLWHVCERLLVQILPLFLEGLCYILGNGWETKGRHRIHQVSINWRILFECFPVISSSLQLRKWRNEPVYVYLSDLRQLSKIESKNYSEEQLLSDFHPTYLMNWRHSQSLIVWIWHRRASKSLHIGKSIRRTRCSVRTRKSAHS